MGTGVGTAISDAGPIIHLHEIGVLSLFRLFDSVHVPRAVWQETVGKDRVSTERLNGLGRIQRRTVEPAEHRLDHLQTGELECLVLLTEHSLDLVLTDDLAVRDVVHELGGTPVGSLGIIVRACRDGSLEDTEAEHVLRELYEESTLFVTEALIEQAIEQIREQL